MSVLALALKRLSLSHGTVPKVCPIGTEESETPRDALSCPNGTSLSAVPMAHLRDSETNGTVGTLGTEGTADAIEERAGLAADSVPPAYLDAWARLNCQKLSACLSRNGAAPAWRRRRRAADGEPRRPGPRPRRDRRVRRDRRAGRRFAERRALRAGGFCGQARSGDALTLGDAYKAGLSKP